MKFSALAPRTASVLVPHLETPESVAFTRYGDELEQDNPHKHIFQHPKGESLKRSVSGKLFKVAKTREHWADVRRSKSYIGDDFIPPF